MSMQAPQSPVTSSDGPRPRARHPPRQAARRAAGRPGAVGRRHPQRHVRSRRAAGDERLGRLLQPRLRLHRVGRRLYRGLAPGRRWPMARHGRARALTADSEPREVRFLRGFSNYLTPKLGLFSGDTWAAVGVSLRNLILNFTILSLSLAAPLSCRGWWRSCSGGVVLARQLGHPQLPDRGVAAAAVLAGRADVHGTLNMARPLATASGPRAGASRLKASTVCTSW